MTVIEQFEPAATEYSRRYLRQALHLWYVDLEKVEPALLVAYRRWLSPAELERGERFRFQRDRERFVVARALLRTVLSRYAEVEPATWRFSADAHGKPRIEAPAQEPQLFFNLSHCKRVVACVVGLHPDVGVDVESTRQDIDCLSIAETYFAKPEYQALTRCRSRAERQRLFLAIWTLKEAYLKAVGTGLTTSLKGFCFKDPTAVRPELEFTDPSDGQASLWNFHRFDGGQTQIALAWRRQEDLPSQVVAFETVPASG